MVDLHEYRLPPKFYDDHRARDLPEEGTSEEVSRPRSVVVRMDEAAFRDLYSDADHYSDSDIAREMGNRGLAASALLTLAALRKQNPELCSTIEQERREKGWL